MSAVPDKEGNWRGMEEADLIVVAVIGEGQQR